MITIRADFGLMALGKIDEKTSRVSFFLAILTFMANSRACPGEKFRAPAIEAFRDALVDVQHRDKNSVRYEMAMARASGEQGDRATYRIVIENRQGSIWRVTENRERRTPGRFSAFREDGRNCKSNLWQAHISRGFGAYECNDKKRHGFLLVREALDDYLRKFHERLEIMSISYGFYGGNFALAFSSGGHVTYYLFNRCGRLAFKQDFDERTIETKDLNDAVHGLQFSTGGAGGDLIEVDIYNETDSDILIVDSLFHKPHSRESQRLINKGRSAQFLLHASDMDDSGTENRLCLQGNDDFVYAKINFDGTIAGVRSIRFAQNCFVLRRRE
jgi:hypothetical protein